MDRCVCGAKKCRVSIPRCKPYALTPGEKCRPPILHGGSLLVIPRGKVGITPTLQEDGSRLMPVSRRRQENSILDTKLTPTTPTCFVAALFSIVNQVTLNPVSFQFWGPYSLLHFACLRSYRTIDVVVLLNARTCDIVICIPSNVDKFEVVLHAFCHTCRVARELLSGILLERCPLPTAHFLYLSIGIAQESKCICTPTLQGVCVDPVNRYPPCSRIPCNNIMAIFKPLLMSSPLPHTSYCLLLWKNNESNVLPVALLSRR
jgi:hypothetical protein